MKFPLLFIILLVSSSCFSQEFLLPYRSGNLWGYADVMGKVIIEPKYDSVGVEIENSRWNVYKNGFAGVIDASGSEILEPIYSELIIDHQHSEYHDYFVKKDSLWGYATMTGRFLLPIKFGELDKCDRSYRAPYTEGYNFFVAENGESTSYSVIDTNETVYLKGITDIEHLSSSFYKFIVDGRCGIYDVMSHEWSVENRFDTIISFPTYYDEHSESIEKDYYFYAKDGDNVFFIDVRFRIEEGSQDLLNILLVPPDIDKSDYLRAEMIPPMISPDAKFMDLSTFPMDETGDVKFKKNYSDAIGSLRLFEEKGKFGLEIVNYGADFLEYEYDAIYVFSNADYRINHGYFLLKKKGKVGVYGVKERSFIVPVEYDSIVPGRYDNVLLVYDKNKVGLCVMGEIFRDFPSHFFRPEFDRFLYWESARSNDGEYNYHHVYFFEKDGQLCPITQRGIRLYD